LKHKGRLTPGYDADFAVLDRDVYKLRPSTVLITKVIQTWVAGTQAYPSSRE
jgi:hypothetical protein